MFRSGLMKPEWQQDMVYLVQFPRSAILPNWSPYCIKLETWLRMVHIKYENISNGLILGAFSKKGQIPFVELNGNEIADTSFTIKELTEYFKKEQFSAHLTTEDQAYTRAFESVLENSLFWCLLYMRSLDTKATCFCDEIVGQHLTSTQKFALPAICYGFASKLKKKLYHQGYGRHSWEDIVSIAKGDLKALNDFMGDKKFFLGDKPSRLDATAFGHLCVHYYVPKRTEIQQYMTEECKPLLAFIDRIKETYWPDWDEACSQLSLDTKFEIKKE